MSELVFSWQKNDYDQLIAALNQRPNIIIVHGKDYESPYHILSSFCCDILDLGKMPLFINPDATRSAYPYLPFTQAISENISKKRPRKPLLPMLVKDVTQSDTIARLVENIVEEHHSSFMLGAQENEIVTHLEQIAEGYTPVFLFNNFSRFDGNSQHLVILLVSGQLNADFPFLRQAKYFFLETDSHFTLAQKINSFAHIDIKLKNPCEKDMPEILEEIAPGLHLSVSESVKLFYLAGGRLSIIDILSRYLQSKGLTMIDTSTQNVVEATLSDRILQMGASGSELKNILELAANIGQSFSISLLKQVSDPSECDSALKKSNGELFTKCDSLNGKFLYNEIWSYFFFSPSSERRYEISCLLERAIYHYDPYDYLARAHYLIMADRFFEACELYFFAYNTFFHEGVTLKKDLEEKIDKLSIEVDLKRYWNILQQVYVAIGNLDFNNSISLLEKMDTVLTPRLLLLKEYLTALCLYRSDIESAQQDAIITMQAAAESARKIEEGFWCDCQTALISFLVNVNGDILTAKRKWKELTYFYTQKSFAPYAQKGLHALERKWSALYSVERAVIRTECSVKYFKNTAFYAQYFMALNNHGANLIVLGKYTEAMEYLNEAVTLLQRFQSIRVNKMYLLNNYCLCAVLDGRISPNDAHNKLLQIAEKKAFGDWSIIFRINCAIYMALSGKLGVAEKNLRDLEIISQHIHDDYYLFYVYANLAAVLYLRGERKNAVSMLTEKCSRAPPLFKPSEKVYIEERTKRWLNIMENTTINDPLIFDTYLINQHPKQTQWAFIGHGFLYSDIQFWSEP